METESCNDGPPTNVGEDAHIYVELLHNIRTLSVQITLPSLCNGETRVTLEHGGTMLKVVHEARTEAVQLPASVSVRGHDISMLAIPASPTTNLSFRLSLEPSLAVLPTDAAQSNTNITPWMAVDLQGGEEFRCAACAASIIGRGTIQQWKNLPSDGWAELMEFWHCHKPDVPTSSKDGADRPGENRGIATSNRVIVQQGVGLVSPLHFLLHPEDCARLQVEFKPLGNRQRHRLSCPQCSCILGRVDATTGGYMVHKPHLTIQTTESAKSHSHDLEKWFACQLLTASETQGVRRLAVDSTEGESSKNDVPTSHLWIFAPDVAVSSSAAPCKGSLKAMKILYRDDVPAKHKTLSEPRWSPNEGELELDIGEWSALRQMLNDSQTLLPPSARKMQDWQVALLRHFEPSDLSICS